MRSELTYDCVDVGHVLVGVLSGDEAFVRNYDNIDTLTMTGTSTSWPPRWTLIARFESAAGRRPAPRLSAGSIMVATQKIQAGMIHARKIFTVTAGDHSLQLAIDGESVGTVPRTTSSEIHRCKACATKTRSGT